MAEKKINRNEAPPAGSGSGGPLNVGWLERVARVMAENDLSTVDVRDGASRVILRRGQPILSSAGLTAVAAAPTAPAVSPMTMAVASSPGAAGGTGGGAGEDAGLVPIKSPMVGTFYSSPKPGEPVFVSVGSVVNDETDVCLIEAMKTFNNVKAGVIGTIARTLIQNGQTVQFDQPLFLVKPA